MAITRDSATVLAREKGLSSAARSRMTASEVCVERFGITDGMWQEVPDPEPGCQHDWIAPVRISSPLSRIRVPAGDDVRVRAWAASSSP